MSTTLNLRVAVHEAAYQHLAMARSTPRHGHDHEYPDAPQLIEHVEPNQGRHALGLAGAR